MIASPKQLAIYATFIAFVPLLSSCAARVQHFESPQAAVSKLEEIVEAPTPEKARALFGPDGEYLLNTGDPVLDKKRARMFVDRFKERHSIELRSENEFELLVGNKSWPFPVPLVKGSRGWYFDAKAGREEILSRRIGENELRALQLCRAIPQAQRIYAADDYDGDGVPEYASRLISTPGARDGLYWPVAEGEDPSPLGPQIAKAADENYTIAGGDEPKPYQGYYFRLFPVQEPAATAPDVLEKPGKYWLLAYPASFGESGVMTFAVNERGWIYEKSLGESSSAEMASAPKVDQSWTRIE